MTISEIQEALADALSSITSSRFVAKGIKRSSLKLPLDQVEKEVFFETLPDFRFFLDFMPQIGDLLEADEFQNRICIIIGNGVLGMNPALLEIILLGQTLRVTAYAKEGLINQHTAQRTIDAFLSILTDIIQNKNSRG